MDQTVSMDSRLEELLLHWEQLKEDGQVLPPEELCEDCPELLEPLRERIEALEDIEARMSGGARPHDRSVPPEETAWPGDSEILAETAYRSVAYHDRGGLGEIYRAEDSRLNREVALKFIRPQVMRDLERRQRFLLEARVTSQLDHPGVVPVYGLGQTPDQRDFYVMRFIRGRSLDDEIEELHGGESPAKSLREKRTRFHGLLRHFVAACRTVAYAHRRGVLHCDIKPANIMLGKFGETLVLDWGEAVTIDQTGLTRMYSEPRVQPETGGDSGSSAPAGGTLAFMAPERLPSAEAVTLGVASDVYSLGATLYKLLTGQVPFRAESRRELTEKIRSGDFPPPREVNRSVPAPLQAVALKAMARRPQERYGTAGELADEIERWLDDDPVAAYRESPLSRSLRWMRRHRSLAQALLVTVAGVVLLALALAFVFGRAAARERLAKQVVTEAREDSLRSAARFAARTVSERMEERLQFLKWEAQREELVESLEAIHERILQGLPEDRSLRRAPQQILEGIARDYPKLRVGTPDRQGETDLLLLDAQGKLVARVPYSRRTVGRYWHHRDYFHGRGRDLEQEEAPNPQRPPLKTAAHLSVVFTNKSFGHNVVGVSRPVWSGRFGAADTVVGVLVMQLNVGRFGELDVNLDAKGAHQQFASLVKLDRNGEGPKGLIIHHPELRDSADLADGERKKTIPSELVRELEDLKRRRRETDETTPPVLRRGFVDPFTGRTMLAAFEPVVLKYAPPEVADTGWIVVVQEQAPPANE